MRRKPGWLTWLARGCTLGGTYLLICLWIVLFSLVWRVSAVRAEDYQARIGPDVEAQLAFLHDEIHAPDSVALRQHSSVWTVFAHTLYGFTRVNTVLLDPDNEARRAGAIQELEWILERLKDLRATADFASNSLPNGVFYLGERNLTLAGLMLIDPDPNPAYEQEFHQTSQLLYRAFMASPSAHLETFPGHCWPADNVPALYALVVHDRLYGTEYGQAARRWVERMQATLDPETGLMASKIDCQSGEAIDLPRGCGTSFTFAFLPDFAPDFARTQYAAYRQHFFTSTLGFAGIREYPAGRGRQPDTDSGPIFLEVGAAATGIGIAATKAMGDEATMESIIRLAEIIGLPIQDRGRKYYLLGQLLIADEIQVWGKTITSWVSPPGSDRTPGWPPLASVSMAYFYAIAAGTAGLLIVPTVWLAWRISRW